MATYQPPNLQDLDLKEFKIIYPLYINSNRTLQQGRRISKEKAVPDPNVQEIETVLSKITGAKIIVELDKRHPREFNVEQPQFLGRVRVSLPPNFTNIKSKYELLIYVANEISKMERKKFKVHQVIQEQQPEPSTNTKNQNTKKSSGNRKKNSRKK